MNPYLELNLSPEASDAEIRSTYLQLVKRFPPAQDPKRFTRIAQAYALIDTPEKRLTLETLGSPAEEATESLTQQNLALLRLHRPRPSWEALCGYFDPKTQKPKL